MVLWTIQHRAAYERMLKTGTLRADERYILWGKEFLEAYRWLSDQMRTRIGLPPAGVRFPVWAWYRWEGVRARPDMRSFLWHWAPKGTPVVLMTVDVPDAQVLLSDFDYWNAVMCGWNLIFPYSDTAVYTEAETRKSWENIFDITCSFDGKLPQPLSTQATMWEVKAAWVKKAEHFGCR